MKKLLLATTVLVGTAGLAAAEVTVSGDARMGITTNVGTTSVAEGDAMFTSRARVSFGLSGESDAGISFGGSFRADNAGGAASGAAGSVYISGAFGKISMGDVDSADNVGQLSGVGFTGLGDTNEVEYSADGVGLYGFASAWNKGEAGACVDFTDSYHDALDCAAAGYGAESASTKVLYTYAADGFSVSASHSQTGDLKSYAIGGTYTTGDVTVGAGYGVSDVHLHTWGGSDGWYSEEYFEDYDDFFDELSVMGHVTDITLFASYVMGATTFKGIYQNKDLSANVYNYGPDELGTVGEDMAGSADTFGVSVDHKIDALTLTGFYISTEVSDAISGGLTPAGDADSETLGRYGIGASYDLGGGASIVGGVAHVDSLKWTVDNDDDYASVSAEKVEDTVFDLGVKFAF